MNLLVGILALQGAVEPHRAKLEALGALPVLVRRSEQLEGLQGIILPGGESTTMIKLLHRNQLWTSLKDFVRTTPTWGICAGAILLAREVSHPSQESLDAINVSVQRNAYGRQLDSFVAQMKPESNWTEDEMVEGVFIRAPQFENIGKEATVLLSYDSKPVMVQSGSVLVSSFHPELTDKDACHRYFLRMIATNS